MFTGIIQELGKITKINHTQTGSSLFINCNLPSQVKSQLGDSIAVNGVCLTITEQNEFGFAADLAPSTLEKTALKNLKINQLVNIETPMRLESFLGGHIVQGHVNDVGVISNIEALTNCNILTITLPYPLLKYCIEEGSITIDGVSLTISNLQNQQIQINIIPHTWNKTIVSQYAIGQLVNVEVDIIAKYMEKWLSPWIKNLKSSEQSLNLNLGGNEKTSN